MFSAVTPFVEFAVLIVRLATGAIMYSPDVFIQAAGSAEAQTAALLIAVFAGASEMLGQSVILVVNRTPLYRFVASIAFTGATYGLTVVTWSAAVLITAPLTRIGAVGPGDFAAVTGVLALAFAPRLLGVFAIAPYFGAALGNMLEVWSMSLAIFGLHVALGLPIGAAVICAGTGFIVAYVFRISAGRLLARPLGRLQRLIAGSALEKTPRQILDDVFANLNERSGS